MNLLLSLFITAYCAWWASKAIYAFRQGWWLGGSFLAAFVAALMALAWLP